MKVPGILILIAVLAAPLAQADQPTILVSAAASLTDVLNSLQAQAETSVGCKVQYNFGGSGALRKQIEEGAPVDVFFSAASEDMDRLQKAGLIQASTRKDLLSNAIALIGTEPAQAFTSVDEIRSALKAANLVAIGNPDTVPAGRYARQALEHYGLSPIVEGKLVLGGNVREVLQYVETGSAPLGFVFSTDALSVKQGSPVRLLFLFAPDALKTPILYPIAVINASKNKDTAARMIEFLQGAAARDAFRRAGFILP